MYSFSAAQTYNTSASWIWEAPLPVPPFPGQEPARTRRGKTVADLERGGEPERCLSSKEGQRDAANLGQKGRRVSGGDGKVFLAKQNRKQIRWTNCGQNYILRWPRGHTRREIKDKKTGYPVSGPIQCKGISRNLFKA